MRTVIEAVNEQKEIIKGVLSDSKKKTISITDNICALDFRKYAIKEEWLDSDDGREFEIVFEDADNVEVKIEDFIKYNFQYTELALELEYEFEDNIDELRDAQNDAMQELMAMV